MRALLLLAVAVFACGGGAAAQSLPDLGSAADTALSSNRSQDSHPLPADRAEAEPEKDGQPYYIKGAGGDVDKIEQLAAYGGNSIRTWGTGGAQEVLDRFVPAVTELRTEFLGVRIQLRDKRRMVRLAY